LRLLSWLSLCLSWLWRLWRDHTGRLRGQWWGNRWRNLRERCLHRRRRGNCYLFRRRDGFFDISVFKIKQPIAKTCGHKGGQNDDDDNLEMHGQPSLYE
jgi:hypothetical protein